MVPIPNNATEITAEWLSSALTAGGRMGEAVVRSVEIERFAEGTGIAADLFRLTPSYVPGSRAGPGALIVKLPSSIPQMREVARSYGLYQREVRFYRDVASTISLRTPHCFFAEFEPATHNFIIVMEDLTPARSGDQIAGMALDEVRLGH